MERLLPEISVDLDVSGNIEPQSLFSEPSACWLEIGFGGGEHLAGQAQRHQDVGIIGCEPYEEGVAKLVTSIDEHGLRNVRIHAGDARDVLDRLTPVSVDRVFILFPDPWPKRRHWKRRLIQPDMLADLHRVIKRGGNLRFATDVKSYADEALAKFLAHGGFEWRAEVADDWRTPPHDHIQTRYESKRLGDCAPVWFDFVRL